MSAAVVVAGASAVYVRPSSRPSNINNNNVSLKTSTTLPSIRPLSTEHNTQQNITGTTLRYPLTAPIGKNQQAKNGMMATGVTNRITDGSITPPLLQMERQLEREVNNYSNKSVDGVVNHFELNNKEKEFHLWHGATEAQWILAVLDDISNKLMLCSYLHSDILKDKIMDVLDISMCTALREHFQVEQQYGEFLDSEVYQNNQQDQKNQELLHELQMCLADSTRTVTRLLKVNFKHTYLYN